MRRTSLVLILLFLLSSLFLLSVLSNILTGYPESPPPTEPERDRPEWNVKEEPQVLLFRVSPATAKLFWRTTSADYYTGQKWLRTTDEEVIGGSPPMQDASSKSIFTVDINITQRETFLPLASANSTLENILLPPIDLMYRAHGLKFYTDPIGNVFKVKAFRQTREMPLVYNISWSDYDVDDKYISLDQIPEKILDKYLQVPDIRTDIHKLAHDLQDASYTVLDQILADVQFLRTEFIYDVEDPENLYERIGWGSQIATFMEQRKGVCIDAATALTILLRIQKIPARISVGYRAESAKEGKLLFYTTGAHAVTEAYLPPYGWVQFDATPPLEEDPQVKVTPFRKRSSPGSRLFYQLSITNRGNSTDTFVVSADSRKEWGAKAAPRELEIEPLQTVDALLEVNIPEEAVLGEKDMITIRVASSTRREIASSILAITSAEDVAQFSTTTNLENMDDAVIRGQTFWINGTVRDATEEGVDNMPIFVFMTRTTEAEGVIVGRDYSEHGDFHILGRVPPSLDVGNYRAIPISLGTTLHRPSTSDHVMKVQATTRIELGSEEQFLLGYGAFHGRLFWDNGTGFAEASISLEIAPTATPSKVRKLTNATSMDGSFRVETRFENPGMYEIRTTFLGNAYIIGSSATRIVELQRGVPTIQILGDATAARGEVFNITGAIQFEEAGIWGEAVKLSFDNELLVTLESRDNGSYTWSFLVNPEEKLGPHFIAISLEESNVTAVHEVEVKSKTTMTTEVSYVAGGLFVLYSVSLSDDHELPIEGAEIVVDPCGVSWKTDRSGNLTFLLDAVKLFPENLAVAARFEGSELYLPVRSEANAILDPHISLPFLLPLAIPTSGAIVFVAARRQLQKRQMLKRTLETKIPDAEATMMEKQSEGLLQISLPDVERQLPNVWGVNEQLRMNVDLDRSAISAGQVHNVNILIDDTPVGSARLSPQGRGELAYVFVQKGAHQIRALLPGPSRPQLLEATINIRIVDYREEIVRLYNKLLEGLAVTGIQVEDEMTAHEIAQLILRKTNFSPEILRRITTCFELAEYSSHLIPREDYKTMYLSLKELNVSLESEE